MTVLAVVISVSIFAASFLLFPEEKPSEKIKIRTEELPVSLSDTISVGEPLFDTLTKRKVGKIEEILKEESGGKISFVITFEAAFIPKSDALRTPQIWFKYTFFEK